MPLVRDPGRYRGENDGLDVWRKYEDQVVERLSSIAGVGEQKAKKLFHAGFHTIADLRRADQKVIAEVDGIGNALAARIKADVQIEDSELGEMYPELDLTADERVEELGDIIRGETGSVPLSKYVGDCQVGYESPCTKIARLTEQ